MRIFVLLLLVAALTQTASAQSASSQSLSGRRAPSFSLPDSTTKQHDILDYRGQWLLVEFMQTDNLRCKDISKKLETAKAKYGAKAALLLIVLAPPENQQTVAKFIAENKITSPMVFDQGQVTIAYFKATPQNPRFDIPHVFAINPSGNIAKDWSLGNADGTFLADLDVLISGVGGKK